MEPICVKVWVLASAALARGVSAHGAATVTFSDADVAALSALSEWLAREIRSPSSTRAGSPIHSSSGAASAFAILASVSASTTARSAARFSPSASSAAATWTWPTSRTSGWGNGKPVIQSNLDLGEIGQSDPRIVERMALVRSRTLAPRVAAWEAANAKRAAEEAEAKTAKEAAAAAKEARLAVLAADYKAALREVALSEPALARAATEGYAVERAVLEVLANRLAAAVFVGSATIDSSTSSREWNQPLTDKSAPSPETFALYDRVVAAVAVANSAISPAIGQWRTSRIVRLDVCPHEGQNHWVTAVLATLDTSEASSSSREITFSLESLDCGHGDDDSE